MAKGYSKKGREAKAIWGGGRSGPVGEKLEEIARTGAQRMPEEMLGLEVDKFLQRL